jgi:hypothetical protein
MFREEVKQSLKVGERFDGYLDAQAFRGFVTMNPND